MATLRLSVLLTLLPTVLGWCPEGFVETSVGVNGQTRCYLLSKEAHTFTECEREVCGPKDATLAMVRSAEENSAVAKLAQDRNSNPNDDNEEEGYVWGVYLGYHEGLGENQWSWTAAGENTFENWAEGEPNNWCLDEQCVAMDTGKSRRAANSGGWMDIACEVPAWCVCEYGTMYSEKFDEEVVKLLKRNEAAYDDCEEEEEAAFIRAVLGPLHGLLVSVLILNLTLLAGVGILLFLAIRILKYQRIATSHTTLASQDAIASGYMPVNLPTPAVGGNQFSSL